MTTLYRALVTGAAMLLSCSHATAELSPLVPSPYEGVSFRKYIEERDLGTLENSVWAFDHKDTPSQYVLIGDLAYFLELYKNYADATDKSFSDIGIDEIKFGDLSFTEDDITRYFDADSSLLEQARILREYVTRTPK